MNDLWKTIKKLLGLKVDDGPVKAPPTRYEIVKGEYEGLGVDKRAVYISAKLTETKKEIQTFLESNKSLAQLDGVDTSSGRYMEFQKAIDLVETEIFLAGLEDERLGLQAPQDGLADKDNTEHAFSDFLEIIKTVSIPAPEFLKKLEQYLERYEEELLYAEARGDYKLQISENKAWLRIPLLTSLTGKKIDPNLPKSELAKFFYPCPQLQYLELESKVPMLPTSLVDVGRETAKARMVPLYISKPEAWYVYIIQSS